MTENFPEFPGDAPAAAEAPAPRVFTPEELAEAARQIQAQNVGVTGPEVGDSVDLGLSALAAGAEAAAPDTAAMLAEIRALQASVAALEAEKRQAHAPDVVKYTAALRDHLAAKANAHPGIQADPDHSFTGVLRDADALVSHAEAAGESGNPGGLAGEVGKVETWVKAHAKRFPHIDYSYVLDLAGEAAQAVAALAA